MLQLVKTPKYDARVAQHVTKTAQEILEAQKEHAEFILSCFETKLELVEETPRKG